MNFLKLLSAKNVVPYIIKPNAAACLTWPIETTMIRYGIATTIARIGRGRVKQNLISPTVNKKAEKTFTST